MNTWSRRLVSLACAFTLACSLTPTLAWGAEADGEEATGDLGSTSGMSPIVEIGTLATATADIEPLTLDPEGYTALKPGNHVRWIDRLDVPDYALEFYKVLEEAVDNDGYRDFLIDDKYYNGTIEGEEEGAYYANRKDSGNEPVLVFLKMKSGEEEEHPMAESLAYIRDIYAAFQRDHPEVFWLNGNWAITRVYHNGYWYDVLMLKNVNYRIRALNYPTESSIKADIVKRDTAVANIMQASKGKTVTEKLEFFNDWLTHNNEYNTFPNLGELQSRGKYPQAWACISALDGREGEKGPVCEGYAEAFKVLCDKAGIPCVLVDGIGDTGWSAEGHMWNNVKVGGSWYAVDVTWNDSSKGGSGKVTGNESRDWLLLGSESRDPNGTTFNETHRIANLVMYNGTSFLNGPVLSATAYPGYGHKVQDTGWEEPDNWDEPENPDTEEPISIGRAAVTVGSKTWTGKALSPASVTVKLNGKTLRKGADYTVSCKGGKKVGSYKVTIKGKGAYTGTKTAAFKILPKGTSVSKLSKAKRGFTVKWKKPSKKARSQIDGYQVRCSTKKSMKGAKTLKVKGASKTSAKVSKLKGGKKYYVQVRSYKKVGGKTYYSGWSKAKAVKTKK